MTGILETLAEYLSLDFVRYAYASGILVSIATALLGTTLVLRRLSYMGDGLSHVAFGAMAVGTALGFANSFAVSLPVTAACAIVLVRSGEGKKIRGDAALAMISVAALAAGYILMNIKLGSSNVSGDVCTTLFGSVSIITLDETDVAVSAAISAAVVLFFAVFKNKVFEVTFDPDFAAACGSRKRAWEAAVAILAAVVTVVAMKLVGTLLVSALLVFPAVSAMRFCRSFAATLVASALIAAVTSAGGITVAIIAETPVGATIVATGTVLLGLSCAFGRK